MPEPMRKIGGAQYFLVSSVIQLGWFGGLTPKPVRKIGGLCFLVSSVVQLGRLGAITLLAEGIGN